MVFLVHGMKCRFSCWCCYDYLSRLLFLDMHKKKYYKKPIHKRHIRRHSLAFSSIVDRMGFLWIAIDTIQWTHLKTDMYPVCIHNWDRRSISWYCVCRPRTTNGKYERRKKASNSIFVILANVSSSWTLNFSFLFFIFSQYFLSLYFYYYLHSLPNHFNVVKHFLLLLLLPLLSS